jgi:hypothetical protein
VATKSCPSCIAEVPVEAFRCKHCFHDFNTAPKKANNGLLVLLAFFAVMLAIGGGGMAYIFETRVMENSLVDKETQSIVFTRTSATAMDTERIPFADVKHIEYITGGSNATFEIVAVTTTDKRYIIKYSDKQIKGNAEQIARLMKKDLVEVQLLKTFAD